MNTNKLIAHSIKSIYYPALGNRSVDRLASILVPLTLNKNEILLNEGEVSNQIYFIQSGLLRQFYYKNGKDLTEHFAEENTVLMSVESFILREPTYLITEALEPSKVFGIPYEPLMAFVLKYVDFAMLYMKMTEYIMVGIQRKIESMRLETSSERYQRFVNERPELVTRVSLANIASYLLMSPETLSRVRAEIIARS